MSRGMLMTFFYFSEGGREKLRTFQQAATPIFQKYGLSIEREFVPGGQGHLGSTENALERPDLVQIVSMESLEKLQAYLADEEMKALAPIRASGLRRMTASFGPSLDIGDTATSRAQGSLHFAALVRFEDPGNSSGLEEFNRRALVSGLFARHGIGHVRVAKVAKTVTALGVADFDSPEAIVSFSVEDPKMLKDYLADPEYLSLSPLRDRGLKSYFFFQGS